MLWSPGQFRVVLDHIVLTCGAADSLRFVWNVIRRGLTGLLGTLQRFDWIVDNYSQACDRYKSEE